MSEEVKETMTAPETPDAPIENKPFDPETPMRIANKIGKGKMKLITPIKDGEKEYGELEYDFTALSGWEFARALNDGTSVRNQRGDMTETQALALFAAAAAKCTAGLDATDIKNRMGMMDAIGAINVATLFFRSSSLAASMRITNE